MTQHGGHCVNGTNTMEAVCLSEGMVLHCLLNGLPDKEAAMMGSVVGGLLVLRDKITDMMSVL